MQVEGRKCSGKPKNLSAFDQEYLKVISLRDRKKSNEKLVPQLVQSSGTKNSDLTEGSQKMTWKLFLCFKVKQKR